MKVLGLLLWLMLMATPSCAFLPSMSVWPYKSRSYDVRARWEYCLKSHVDIIANGSVGDYGALVSQELAKLGADGGGSVRLFNGAYIVKSPIIFKNNTCLLGQSLNGVILKVADRAPDSGDIRGVLHGINVENVTVGDFTIDVNKEGQEKEDSGKNNNNNNKILCKNKNELTKYGTYFEASRYLWVTNTRVMNACAYGYDFPGNNETYSRDVVLENSYADSSGKDGVKIFRMVNSSLRGVSTLNNGRHGVHIAGSENILLDSNTFISDGQKESYEGCGVMISDRYGLWTEGVIAKYTRAHNYYRAAFCLARTRWVALIDSTITNYRRKQALCYELDGAENVTIIRGSCWTLNSERKIILVATNFTSQAQDTSNTIGIASPEPAACGATEIEADGFCCPGICGTCGGDGCSDRAPYKACCVNDIRASEHPSPPHVPQMEEHHKLSRHFCP